MASKWPDYLLARARQQPPKGCGVVARSTPVVSFGHPLEPEVATLGINPSSAEFLSSGRLLEGSKRRLATLSSIGASDYTDIDRVKANAIIDDCASYYQRNPYRWFNVLDRILTAAFGVSYFHETACHLDLVQWATDPIWKKLSPNQQEQLLDGDREFLQTQLRHEGYKVVLVNGATAVRWTEEAGVVGWEPLHTINAPPPATVSGGRSEGALFIGWSCNLQSQPGALRHVERLTEIVSKEARDELGGPELTNTASFEQGTHYSSRSDFVRAHGRLELDEQVFGSLSAAAVAVSGNKAEAGWDFWGIERDGRLVHALRTPRAATRLSEQRRAAREMTFDRLNDPEI